AYYWFLWVGAASYELPALLVLLGLGCFFDFFSYLRRRWIWTLVLFVCCTGLLDLYKVHLRNLEHNLHIMAGGVLGVNLNRYLFGYFGTVGATIIFLMLSFISVLLLTNFQFGQWLRALWERRTQKAGLTPDEQALDRRSRELQKQAKKLREEVERSGLGVDGRPGPEPMVRDLSITQSKSPRAKKPGPSEP